MGTELQVTDAASLIEVIGRAASDPSIDVEKMERLISLHERIVGKQAESAFNVAMSLAQSEMGPVSTDATNPQTRSRYATYGKLDSALRPIYTQHGFALSFDTGEAAEGYLRVVCHVSHRDGHSRDYHVDMPSDGKGAKGGDVMTKTHATGAAASYGMRYLLKMIFNVAIGEDDRDGNGPSRDKKPNKKQESGNEIFDLAISALQAERDVSRIDALCERFRQRFSERKVSSQHVIAVAEAAGQQEAAILNAEPDHAVKIVCASILSRSGFKGDHGKILSAAAQKPRAKMVAYVKGEVASWLKQ